MRVRAVLQRVATYPRSVALLSEISAPLLPEIPASLAEISAKALQWPELIEHLSRRAQSPLGRAWVSALKPSADAAWIEQQQQRSAEMQQLIAGGSFDFRGIFDVTETLDKARIDGSALEAVELRAVIVHAERVEAWRQTVLLPPDTVREQWPGMEALSAPLMEHDLSELLRSLSGKIEPDGSLSDDASPELRRIRRALEQQHRAIEASLRRALAKLSEDGSTQDALITVRGERFVIPVKAEFKRKVGGVVHGSSSSGATVFVEPLETIEHNNELTRLLDEEQSEIHRILVAMTRAIAAKAEALLLGAGILAEADAHQGTAQFAVEFACVRPRFAGDAADEGEEGDGEFALMAARHPLLEMRLRAQGDASRGPLKIVPLTIALPEGKKQMIVSGPNTGGKTVALKTAGLLALMAQSGVPVPAQRARLPLFTAIYADIGDAQSIEQNLSTFSAHVVNVDRISRVADERSLVLLDELGSATDPEEGAALAVAVAEHFLERDAWCIITTHLTSLKVYAAKHEGVLNAAVGFDEVALAPTYDLRLGVPGASAGLNIAARLGLDPAIVANARAQMTTQQIDIGRFLDELHAQLTAAGAERAQLAATERALAKERLRLEQEGRAEQQARTRELERQLKGLIEDFESQLRDTVKAIDDKTVAQKIARDSALRIARLKREFSEQFQTTVVAHNAPAQSEAEKKAADRRRDPKVGDLVRLKSLNREGRVVRLIDAKTLEVSVGPMKTRVPRTDVAEVVATAEKPLDAVKRRGGISVSTSSGGEDSEYLSSEINVIGKTADEAESDVERFVERAFLAGLPRIRVVHGVGMGILRRTLREFLGKHPHVTSVSEPPYNEGGQGATIVELRQ
jgi:DNA mismatch repair protein MutS2